MITVLIFVVCITVYTHNIENQREEFCEDKGGEYQSSGDCFIEEDGEWIHYVVEDIGDKYILVKE